MSVPPHHLSALGLGREAPGPALVHGVADVVVDGDGDGGVTGDALHGLAVDQAVPFELPGERGALAGRRRPEASSGTWTTTKNGLPVRLRIAPTPTDHLGQGIADALVPGRPAVGGHSVCRGLERGLRLGIGLAGQLGRHGAVRVVEAHEAPIVIGPREGSGCGQRPAPSCGRCRRGRAPMLPWPAPAALRSVSGVATSATARTLSKEIHRRTRTDEVREVPGLLAACVRVRAAAVEMP